jgi:hypothetical protein
MPIEKLNQTTGGNFYNMTYMSGVPAEHLKILKLFRKSGVKIKRVVVGLDIFSFRSLPIADPLRVKFFPETWKEWLEFYYFYIILPPSSGMLKEIRFNKKEAWYDLFGTGMYHFIKKDRQIKDEPEKHGEKFPSPYLTACNDRTEKTIAELLEIRSICESIGAEFKVFINPLNPGVYFCEDIEYINRARKALAEKMDYWDFSRISSVTLNNLNFYDQIHYRQNVGSLMISRLYRLNDRIPDDFGFYADNRNVSGYTEMEKKKYMERKKSVKTICLPCARIPE